MWVEGLSISNFRSFGSEPAELRPQQGLNILVGENNTGKSSIFSALRTLLLRLQGNAGFEAHDTPWGSGSASQSIEVIVRLSPNEMDALFSFLFHQPIEALSSAGMAVPNAAIAKLRNMWDTKATFSVRPQPTQGLLGEIKLGEWSVQDNHIQTGGPGTRQGVNAVVQAVVRSGADPERYFRHGNAGIDFNQHVSSYLASMLMDNLHMFADVRSRPTGIGGGAGANISESFEGSATADLLMNLKNGDHVEREEYRVIQDRLGVIYLTQMGSCETLCS